MEGGKIRVLMWNLKTWEEIIFSNIICHISLESSREAAICGALILAPMWSLPQDDKTHESAFKNPFHAGVFHQPELGMEHIQYRNADVQAESWRPKSEYSTDNQQENLTHSEFRIIWPGELMNKGCFCYTHRIFFSFLAKKISECYQHSCRKQV